MMESQNVHTSSIRDQRNQWKSSTKSKRKELQPYCYSQVRTKKWCADSMECYCYLWNVQWPPGGWENSLRKTLRRTKKGLIFPRGAMVEYHPISTGDQSRLHQFGKKNLFGIVRGCALIAEEFGKKILWLRISKNWRKQLTPQKFFHGVSMRTKYWVHKIKKNLYFQ